MSNQLQITGGAKVRNLQGVITGTSGVLSSVPLGGANGVATLDSGGKVPVSQLPSSVVTYLGTWDASTNTPTLTNGTGDAGDMYICNVAGTVNFGAGPITFAVGDWVLYGSGTWQKSNGQNGTVTSVAVTESGNALTITGSPITTAGTINIGFAGSSTQYIAGDGTLVTFPTIVSEAQNLITDVYNETGATLTKGTIVYINGGHGNLPTVTKALATSDATSAQTYGMVQADITNNNNGHVVVIGRVENLDTQAYANGTQLYLSSTTAGAYTSTKQYAPAHLVYVGIVTRSHPTQGVIEVKIQNGYELDELHNVSAQTPSNNDGIFYNSSNSLWEAKSIASALGYTPLGGSGTAGNVPYYTAANTLGSENGFMYDSSTNRLGVNTTSPNATIGANCDLDGNYGLLVKNGDSNYNGIGFGVTSNYGNLIEAQKNGSAPQRNLTLLNNAGFISIDGSGNLGINQLTPICGPSGIGGTGIDIYSGSATAASLGFHTIYTGSTNTVGAYLSLNSSSNFIIRNSSGQLILRADGDLSLNTNGTTRLLVDSSTGKIGIGGPASITEMLTVNGNIRQTGSISGMVKTNSSGVFLNAVAGTDYVDPSTLSGYVPTSRTISINGLSYDLSDDRAWIVGNITGSGSNGRVAFWDSGSNITNNATFVWNDVNACLGIGAASNITSKVTIFSSTAATQLKIAGSAPAAVFTDSLSSPNYVGVVGLATANNNFVTGSAANDFVIATQTSGNILFGVDNVERMRLRTNGNLGIGGIAGSSYRLNVFDASPMIGIESTGSGNMYLRLLQTGAVRGSLYWINADSTLYLSNNAAGIKFQTSGADPALTLASNGAATFASGIITNSSITINDTNGGLLLFRYSGNTDWTLGEQSGELSRNFNLFNTFTNTINLSVNRSTGNVGIGTNAPAAKLDVVGQTAGLGGTAYFNSSFVQDQSNYRGIVLGYDTSGQIGVIAAQTPSAASNLAFWTYSGTAWGERMRISYNGNVGIGTSSPTMLLDIVGTPSTGYTSTRPLLNLQSNQAYSTAPYTGINFSAIYNSGGGATSLAFIGGGKETSGDGVYGGFLKFSTRADGSSDITERMRITSGGSVLIGTTSDSGGKLQITGGQLKLNNYWIEFASCGYIGQGNQITGALGAQDLFLNAFGSSGRIFLQSYTNGVYLNTSATSWTGWSDERLKNINGNIENAVDKLNTLRAVNYSWKSDETKKENLGLIAQDVEKVFPQVVDSNKLPNNIDDTEYLGVRYSDLVPVLVAAIQELKSEIDELKNK